MYRKVLKHGSSRLVTLPRPYLDALGLDVGSRVEVLLDEDNGRIVIIPAPRAPTGIDESFAGEVDRCLKRYRRVIGRLADD